jgi:hypothetical protein
MLEAFQGQNQSLYQQSVEIEQLHERRSKIAAQF